MKSVNKIQIAVIAGSLILFVLLLFANTSIPKKEDAPGMSGHAGNAAGSISTVVESAKSALTTDQKAKIEKLEGVLKTSTDKKIAFENIIKHWDTLQHPVVGAFLLEQSAMTSPTESNWSDAANHYFKATRFAKEVDKAIVYGKAIECFQKVLDLNPKNVDAKINLGACYVEGSAEPMKGITLLREVEKTDSNNVNLQLNFAFFSEKSGQWDKAISRFQKVLKIQPDYIEAYVQLADAYEQKGDKAKAIENLEKYASLVEDETIKTEVQKYINKLKN